MSPRMRGPALRRSLVAWFWCHEFELAAIVALSMLGVAAWMARVRQ